MFIEAKVGLEPTQYSFADYPFIPFGHSVIFVEIEGLEPTNL